MRWLVLLALLFAIGYATKTSTEFSAPRGVDLGHGHADPADSRQPRAQ